MPIRTNLKSLAPRREQHKREIVLLSKGYTSPNTWPGGRITVYPWDNEVDEWVAENLRRLTKEEFVFNLVAKCCNLNGGSIENFISDEINLILLVSRARLTNDRIRYLSVCPFCSHKKEETVLIPDELEPLGVKPDDYPGYDTITLPEITDVVKLRPLTVKDERMVVGRLELERKALSDATLRTVMRLVFVNDTKPDTLAEAVQWYRALSPADAKFFDDEGRRLTPHLNTAIPHKCDECAREFKHVLDFSTEFFR
jgi:hypothetical protein